MLNASNDLKIFAEESPHNLNLIILIYGFASREFLVRIQIQLNFLNHLLFIARYKLFLNVPQMIRQPLQLHPNIYRLDLLCLRYLGCFAAGGGVIFGFGGSGYHQRILITLLHPPNNILQSLTHFEKIFIPFVTELEMPHQLIIIVIILLD